MRSGTEPGVLKVTASAEGLRAGSAKVRTTPSRSVAVTEPAAFNPDHPSPPNYPQADASYSGRPDTLPAAMLDGDPATGWSNAFSKAATALLPLAWLAGVARTPLAAAGLRIALRLSAALAAASVLAVLTVRAGEIAAGRSHPIP